MRLSLAAANRAAIPVLAALIAGCSNTTSDSQALPLDSRGAVQPAERERSGRDVAVEFAYVTNFYSRNVSAYAINASTGALTQVAGSPFAAGNGAVGVAVAPTGKFVYVTNQGADNVSGYEINATSGALTPVRVLGYRQPSPKRSSRSYGRVRLCGQPGRKRFRIYH